MDIKHPWYSKEADINSPETIHYILMFGSLKDIAFLKESVGEQTMREFFLRYPKKIYTSSALHFIKNFILGISTSIDEQRYLKYTSRNLR